MLGAGWVSHRHRWRGSVRSHLFGARGAAAGEKSYGEFARRRNRLEVVLPAALLRLPLLRGVCRRTPPSIRGRKSPGSGAACGKVGAALPGSRCDFAEAWGIVAEANGYGRLRDLIGGFQPCCPATGPTRSGSKLWCRSHLRLRRRGCHSRVAAEVAEASAGAAPRRDPLLAAAPAVGAGSGHRNVGRGVGGHRTWATLGRTMQQRLHAASYSPRRRCCSFHGRAGRVARAEAEIQARVGRAGSELCGHGEAARRHDL
mmetsp:Transcript_141522/g.452450  ORF Transcript_141522/g.452450 Transcript_141522/m.452450 type:complete len:258 (+) Transcript_141522:675-1448(+)